ncbi:MAG TPA: hypothetical protein DCS97_02825 [Planctomycetes bacterium]|nr:hypothetical protein [Planctomycetota bacterium]
MHLTWAGRARRHEGHELVRLSCASGALLTAHDHDFPELFWVERGVCSHLVGGSRTDLPTGSLVFIRATDVHQLRADAGSFTICNITLNPAWAADLEERHGQAWRWAWPRQGAPRTLRLGAQDLAQLGGWFEALWPQAPDRLATEGFILDVLRLVLPQRGTMRDAAPVWLRTTLAALRDPTVCAQGIPGLVRRAGVSREHLARACRRYRQRSPGELVAEARTDQACRLLRHTDDSMIDIADACGFGSPAQFYRRFHARFGRSPAAWRRSERRDAEHQG